MISSHRRLSVLPHLAFSFIALIGPYVDPADEGSPVLFKVDQLFPLQWWILGFTVPLFAAIFTFSTRSYKWWALTNISLLFLASSWLIALLIVRLTDDVYTSPTGFGLWVFVVLACLINARIKVSVTTSDGET